MSDNPPPLNNESTSAPANEPRAKKAKTSEQISTNDSARPVTARGGNRKIKLTLYVADVDKLIHVPTLVESEKETLAGINWSITAQMTASYMTLCLNASHPSASEWHCKVSFDFRSTKLGRCDSKNVIFVFTEKSPEWSYTRWFHEQDVAYEDEWTVSCEVTTLNCYVTDGAFGCQSRFHDVTFVFGSRCLYGNKGFLAANAECFEAMFFGDFSDKNKDVVTLKKVKADDFAEFLKALAPGQVPIKEKNVITLLRTADRFQAHELAERCTLALLGNTQDIRFTEKLQVADELSMDNFRDTLIETVCGADIVHTAVLENENKFSKTTWVKLLIRYVEMHEDRYYY